MFSLFFFFFNDTATTEIYTLSLHDALPIWDNVEVMECEPDHTVDSSIETELLNEIPIPAPELKAYKVCEGLAKLAPEIGRAHV